MEDDERIVLSPSTSAVPWQGPLPSSGYPSVKKRKSSFPSSPSGASFACACSSSSPDVIKRPTSSNKRARKVATHPLARNSQASDGQSKLTMISPQQGQVTGHSGHQALSLGLPFATSPPSKLGPTRSPLQNHIHLSALPPSPPALQMLPVSARTCKSCKRVAHSTVTFAKFRTCYLCSNINCGICVRVCHGTGCGQIVCKDCATESSDVATICHPCLSKVFSDNREDLDFHYNHSDDDGFPTMNSDELTIEDYDFST